MKGDSVTLAPDEQGKGAEVSTDRIFHIFFLH